MADDPAADRQTAEAEWYAERLNLEQLLHQCERERDALVTSRAKSDSDLITSRLELDQSRSETTRLTQALEDAHDRLQRLDVSRAELAHDLDTERTRTAQLIARTVDVEAEVDRLRDECARYSERQIQINKQLNETERALAMEKALMKPVKIQLGDAEQRHGLLERQNSLLQREVESRAEQLLQVQREHGAQVGELTAANQLHTDLCKHWQQRYEASAEEMSALKCALSDALNRLQEEKNASITAACQYQSELDAERRLSATLKRSLDESKQSIAELDSVIEALRTDYKAATDRALQSEHRQADAESALRIAQDNLDNLRHDLQAVHEQNRTALPPIPSSAAAAGVSLSGVTLEDLYGRLQQTNQLLIDERAKSRKLQLYLEQIEDEIREQSPLLKERQADIQNLVKVNNSLAIRVRECNYHRDLIERKLNEALQRAESEYNQRQQLIQFIRARGLEGYDDDVADDMQVVAVLSKDDDDNGGDVETWRHLVEQLETELKQRDLQLARLQTQIRSRQLLVKSAADTASPTPSSLAVVQQQQQQQAPPPQRDEERFEELRQQIELLQDEKSASERQLQASVDDARGQCHALTVKLSTTEGHVALLSQKLDWISSQATRFSADNDRLRAQDAQRDAMLIVTQEKISTLSAELADANQRYTRSSTQLQQVRAQLDLARQTEERLTEQCGDMAVLRQHNEQLLAAMHAVQQKLETGQSANVQQLTAEKDRIYQDMLQAQKQAAIERRSLQQNIKVVEEQCQSLQSQLEIAQAASAAAHAQLAQLSAAASSADDAHAKLLDELRAVKHERDLLAAAHAQTGDESGGGGGGGGRQLMIELAHAQAEAQSLQEKVSALAAESGEWRTLCEQRAAQLDDLEADLRAVRHRADSDAETLRQRVEALTEQCRHCDQQCEDLLLQLDQKDSVSVSQAKELQMRAEDAELRAAQAADRTQLAVEIAESKVQEAAEYRRRYETELTGHAAAVTALNAIRVELASAQADLSAARQSESDAVDALGAVQSQSQREIARLTDHLAQARETIANLTKKNDLLLAQIETGRIDDGDDADAAARTRQIVTFLRTEKETAEAEAESAARSVVRLTTECDTLRAALDQARAEIAQLHERADSASVVVEKAPSADLAVLLESNQMLRSQKMDVMKQLKEVEERLAQVQDSAGPMREEIAQLQGTVMALQAEKSALHDDVERWKSRNQQILSRYNQVDPELYRQAKDALAEAKQEVVSLQSKSQLKDSQIGELQDKLARANQGQANIETIRKSAVFNLQQVNALKRELASRPDPVQFGARLSEAQKCIKTLRALCSRLRAVLEKRNESVANLQGQVDSQKSDISTLTLKAAELQDRLTECEQSLQKTEERHASELSSSQEHVNSLQQQLAEAIAATSEPVVEERCDDIVGLKRPSSPTVQPVPKKLKPTESEESPSTPPVTELEMEPPLQPEQHQEQQTDKSEKPQDESGGTVPAPIRRLRRNRATPAIQEQPVVAEPVHAAQEDEDVEVAGDEEKEPAAAVARDPIISDAEEGEVVDDTSDPNHQAMDI